MVSAQEVEAISTRETAEIGGLRKVFRLFTQGLVGQAGEKASEAPEAGPFTDDEIKQGIYDIVAKAIETEVFKQSKAFSLTGEVEVGRTGDRSYKVKLATNLSQGRFNKAALARTIEVKLARIIEIEKAKAGFAFGTIVVEVTFR